MALVLQCDHCGNLRPDGDVHNAVARHGWVWSDSESRRHEAHKHYCSWECWSKAHTPPEPPPQRSFSG